MSDDDNVIPIRKAEPTFTVGGPVDKTSVSLCLYGETLDPDDVTRRMGCAPTNSFRKGHRLSPPRSKPLPHGGWFLTVDGRPPTGPNELVKLLLHRFPAQDEFWDGLRRDFRVVISFGIYMRAWNRGFALDADAMRLLARTGGAIDFDLYANLEDDG